MTSNTLLPPAPRFLIDTADAEIRWGRTLSAADVADRRQVRGWPGDTVLNAFDFAVRADWVEDSRFWKRGDYAEATAYRQQLESVLRWGAGVLDPEAAEHLVDFCNRVDGGGLYAEDWNAFRNGAHWAALEARADDAWFSRTCQDRTLEHEVYNRLVAAGFEEMLPPDAPAEAPEEVRRWINFCALHGASLLDDAGHIVGDWADRAVLVLAMTCGQVRADDLLPDWLYAAGRCWQVVALLERGTGRFSVAAADAAEAAARLRADLPDAKAWSLRITAGRLHPEAAAEALVVPPAATGTPAEEA